MRLSNQSAEIIAQHKQPPGLTGEAAATAGIAFGASPGDMGHMMHSTIFNPISGSPM
ncbi:hypothetical protein J3D54_003950 [Pseudomonas sp. GGS8]|uniref:hypothetical protein n=1 Tax=Pseudomonas sp. GGS8 TaxID=2817892 RepID=UPI0020A0A1A9|nr:hypothetical protein [Pseudomonas sp. GGS8]MCP1444818.1 hypothetical protein [Pseudomonas sp. GGS8]